ncbi:MAG: DUF3047 domain-containing protein [Leptospirales bacterium]|nr:DUF3047 domain-containing protein [Leptospirales bacterium]
MKKRFIISISLLITALFFGLQQSKDLFSQSDYFIIEDFQKYSGNPFSVWTSRDEIKKATAVYKIVEDDGKKFLRASTVNVNNSVQIGKGNLKWDIKTHPYLSWEWRVRTLPDKGSENNEKTNDSAAGLYVVYQTKSIPLVGWQYQPANWIKYVWSTTLPVGTVIPRKITKAGFELEGRYVVVASGENDLDEWITFKRNVVDDYQKYFGTKPPYKSMMIGILTDSDNTKSKAEADYGVIKASKN